MIPSFVRIVMAHAAVQRIADGAALDVLHIKGAALDPTLVWPGRTSTDVDVLSRPSQVRGFVTALEECGWQLISTFERGSAFEHAATFSHEHWGYLDLHRKYPGIDRNPEGAFDALWRGRQSRRLASVDCSVPSLAAQALVVLLHAARSGSEPKARLDVRHVWDEASPAMREEILRCVEDLGAEVGFSVILGELERHRGRADYELWRVSSQGGTRIEEWNARILAAPTFRRKLSLIIRAPLVNVEHLELVRHRPVTKLEVLVEFFARPWRGLREEVRRRSRWRRGG